MKILYGITKSEPFGGAQRYVFDLTREAKKAGHDVAVLCGGNGSLVEKLKAENIRVIPILGFGRDTDWFGDFFRLLFIIKTVWREKPQVFHINSAKMGGAGIFSGRLLGVPHIIFTANGWAFNEPRPFWQRALIKFFSWLTIACAHKTICVSEQTKKQIASWPLIKYRLVVVRNGVEPFNLMPRAEARQALGIHDRKALIMGVNSELHRIKGLDVLIKAWTKVVRNHEAQLIVMSDGEERQNLEKLIETLGLTQSITLKGYVDNARQYLLAFDLFCMPSRSEALPYALLEAGWAGLPVVASSVGGIPEIIDSGANGILVEKENADALFSALVLLYENLDLRIRLGNNLKQTIKKDFSIKKMITETLRVYSS